MPVERGSDEGASGRKAEAGFNARSVVGAVAGRTIGVSESDCRGRSGVIFSGRVASTMNGSEDGDVSVGDC